MLQKYILGNKLFNKQIQMQIIENTDDVSKLAQQQAISNEINYL